MCGVCTSLPFRRLTKLLQLQFLRHLPWESYTTPGTILVSSITNIVSTPRKHTNLGLEHVALVVGDTFEKSRHPTDFCGGWPQRAGLMAYGSNRTFTFSETLGLGLDQPVLFSSHESGRIFKACTDFIITKRFVSLEVRTKYFVRTST